MRFLPAVGLLLAVGALGCGSLKSLAEFDPKLSGVRVSAAIAPADGVTSVQVAVQLRYSATVAARGIAVDLAASDANAVLGATSGVTDANGIFATTLISRSPGVVHLAANIKGQPVSSALQATVEFVSIAQGASLAFGSIATVGVPQSATVTITDKTGQRVLYYTGTVAFSSSDTQAVLPPLYQFSSSDQGQHSFDNITFNTPGVQSLQVADASNPRISAAKDGINVSVKTAPMFEVSGIAAALAGTSNHVRLRAVDVYSQTLANYTGNVHFSSSDPQAQLPADTTFTATDAGIKVLPLVLKTSGRQTVSAVDTNNLAINGTQSDIAVLVQADRFALVTQATTSAGVPVSVQLAAVDAYGNVDPNFTGQAALTSSDPRVVVPPVYAFTPADAGVHDANAIFYTAGAQTLAAQGSRAGFVGQTNWWSPAPRRSDWHFWDPPKPPPAASSPWWQPPTIPMAMSATATQAG